MAFKLAKKTAPKKTVAKKTVAKKTVAAKPKFKGVPKRVEEDDAPTPRKKSAAGSGGPGSGGPGGRKGVAAAGWGGADEVSTGGDYIKNLDFANDAASQPDGTKWFVIKFMEDAPYANVSVHWIEGRKGKRSFVCYGDSCPLCDVGNSPKAEYRFNVATLTSEDPRVRSWNAGWKIYQKIKAAAAAPLTKPLTKHFFLVYRTGTKWNEMAYDMDKVTKDDLASAYPDLYVPSASEIADLTPYTLDEDVSKEYSTLEELEEIAVEIVEGEG
jgi:hypothetical protein